MALYDPHAPIYLGEKPVRDELTRVFDVCDGCRRCVGLCASFPTLFDLLEGFDDRSAGNLTPSEQDVVVDQCFQCKLCAVECPYTPGRQELEIDFPRLMLRAVAMRRSTGQLPARGRVTVNVLGRSDLLGRLGTSGAPIVARAAASRPGSFLRRFVSKMTGVSAVRDLSPFASRRFTQWFGKRTSPRVGEPRARAVVFPTCLVEYQATEIGEAVVRVYEAHGIECSVSGAGCCGAPWQHAGDIERFTEAADKNVAVLAAEIRAGADIVVPQPTCGYVIRHEYVDHVSPARRTDAELVARHTRDVAEHLVRHRETGGGEPVDSMLGDSPTRITYHVAGHLAAQEIGVPARKLLEDMGAEVHTLVQSNGNESLWELRSAMDAVSADCVDRLATQVERVDGEIVIGDCRLSNVQTAGRTGARVDHPMQVIASVYGLGEASDEARRPGAFGR